jgi:hypothetical protein
MDKPKPIDFGYDMKYGWPDKEKRQAYRKAMAEYQKYLYSKIVTKQ